MAMEITKDEINSLLFYQGGCENIRLRNNQKDKEPFYCIDNAYTILNVLLFPDTENERIRFIEEDRFVNLDILDYVEELINVYRNIFSAMCKFSFQNKDGDLHVYRQDRMAMYPYIKKGEVPSFISASIQKDLELNFHDKKEILLLEIESCKDTVYIDMNQVLGELSKYPDETEIVFAPFSKVDYYEVLELTEEEKQLKDINGNGPKRKLLIFISGVDRKPTECIVTLSDICNPEYIKIAKTVLEKYMKKEIPEPAEQIEYMYWKKLLHVYLKTQFQKIYDDLKKEDFDVRRMKELLLNDISYFKIDADQKRKRYKKKFERYSVALSVMSPLVTFFLSLSFIEKYEMWWKVISLVISVLCAVLSGICCSLSYQWKWKQRTTTFLRLDELERDILYDLNIDEKRLQEYINRFKNIMAEDDRICEENTMKSLNHLESVFQKPDLK